MRNIIVWLGERETDEPVTREERVGGSDEEDGRVYNSLEGTSVGLGKRLRWA